MLIAALDDKTATITDEQDAAGSSLRICDLAYNQLVLNLRIAGVLRMVRADQGTGERDYHINRLKEQL
jgi:hypothetical protein